MVFHPRSILLRRLYAVAVLAALVFITLSTNAIGESDWEHSEYKDWTVTSVTVRGLDSDTASQIRNGLALARRKGLLGSNRPVFFPEILNQDIKRVRLFLAVRGYPRAVIKPQFEPDPRRKHVAIVLMVDPGAAVRVAEIVVDGIPADIRHETGGHLPLQVDSVFVDEDLHSTTDDLTTILLENGYAKATVKSRVHWQDSTRVSVRFTVSPGEVFYFGDIVVAGAREDLVPLVKRTMAARRGRKYSPKTIENSHKDLRTLGLFKQIRIDLIDAAADTLDIEVDVVAREMKTIQTGVRYRTDTRFEGDVSWTNRNIFRAGRGASAGISVSAVKQRAEVSAWWPAVLLRKSRAIGTVGVERENEESYELSGIGTELVFRYDQSLQTRLRLGITLSDIDVVNKSQDLPPDVSQDGRLVAFTFGWEMDRGDDPIVRTKGSFTRVRAEFAPAWGFSEYHYWLVEPTASVYLPLAKNTVVATRLTVGAAEPTGESTSLLPSKAFYSGGASSMRGFERRKLGPLDSAGAPLGGEALFEASLELRFPLFWRITGAGFVDAGQVWPTLRDARGDQIEVAVGPGLWVNTVVGPLRADVGFRLTDYIEGQPDTVFHFSIGPAF